MTFVDRTARWSGCASRAGTLLLLVLGAACRDGGTGPEGKNLALEIRHNSVPAEEETIGVGDQLRLSAGVREATGEDVEPAPRVRWTSTVPAVASVDTGGVVTGVQVGTTLVIATVASYADTVQVNVAQRVTAALACEAGDPRIRLAPGEVFTTTGERAVTLCIEGGASGAAGSEFVMIPFNASAVPGSSLALELNAVGVVQALGPPSPSPRPTARDLPMELSQDLEFHELMREQSSRGLEDRLRSGAGLVSGTLLAAAVPAVGDLLRLNVETGSDNGCTTPDYRTGRVVTITERAIVVADTANPRGSRPDDVLTDADFRSFGETFDTLVWRVDTQNFGEPTDIDENKRVIIFYTRAVNEMTKADSRSYIAGFFYNRDLFRKAGKNACAGSNMGEMFYMMVPDPRGEINMNVRSRDFVRSTTVGVLAHEFQHLINDSRRLYVTKAPVWEDTWLNEGLSHIAEELVFYATSGLTPGRNISPTEMSATRVADAYDRYNTDNVERFIDFLERPQENSLMGADELPTRGAAWAFLRYAADRMPGDDAGLWKNLVGSKTQGLANLQTALNANPRDWMQDWLVAVYTDDVTEFPVESRFQQPSWNFRRLIPTLRNSLGIPTYSRYPLATLRLQASSPRSLPLKGGGAAYLRFGVAAGQTGAVRTVAGGLPAPSRLRIAIVRTR